MVPILKIRAIVRMRAQIHERAWVLSFNNTPRKSCWIYNDLCTWSFLLFSFPVGFDPPGRLQIYLMGIYEHELHLTQSNHSKKKKKKHHRKKLVYMYKHIYMHVCISVHIHKRALIGRMTTNFSRKWDETFNYLYITNPPNKQAKTQKTCLRIHETCILHFSV